MPSRITKAEAGRRIALAELDRLEEQLDGLPWWRWRKKRKVRGELWDAVMAAEVLGERSTKQRKLKRSTRGLRGARR